MPSREPASAILNNIKQFVEFSVTDKELIEMVIAYGDAREKDIINWVDEYVIGGDVDAHRMSGGSITAFNIYIYQNSLRVEQRKRLYNNK